MKLFCRRMPVLLSLPVQRCAQPRRSSVLQLIARRYFGLEAITEGQKQKRTALVTGSSRGMYDNALSFLYLS